uniref:Uncharacterized protein n=1 Tax=Oryza sativa subsp. japonica TaxID=39947 RepID=Q6K611_ORYSJ|nr:hypothetical protein [Oryza sativa Japonica Group]BAD23236.1 hypothetical protein [Oryza sativa Japonica Group]
MDKRRWWRRQRRASTDDCFGGGSGFKELHDGGSVARKLGDDGCNIGSSVVAGTTLRARQRRPPKLEGLSDSDDDGGSELGDNRSDGAGLDRGRFANDDLGSCGASAPMTMAADYDSGNDGLQ